MELAGRGEDELVVQS